MYVKYQILIEYIFFSYKNVQLFYTKHAKASHLCACFVQGSATF